MLAGRGAGKLALVALLLLLGACERKPEEPDIEDLNAARQAAMTLDVRFRTQILDRLEREDPVAIYMFYRDHAAEFVNEASVKAGFEVRRIALRVRNPANEADEWETRQLETFEAMVQAGYNVDVLEKAEIVTEGKNKWMRWIKPVGMNETCMVCHGDTIPPGILKQIRMDYADDNAKGFYEFELRGAYSVRKFLSGPNPPPPPIKITTTPSATPSPTPTPEFIPEPQPTIPPEL